MIAVKFTFIATLAVLIAMPVMAADEFGDRFTQQAPAALTDDAMLQANQEAAAASAMENMEPAAGDAAPPAHGPDAEALADEAEGALDETAQPAAENPGN